ncbi:MAG: NADPH-dependent FMN reductase [Brumimicrobium sp.]|nr:NADPH-dependent FMN reductase [Brumimicrobium sp.]
MIRFEKKCKKLKILAISGSASLESSNTLLLETVKQQFFDKYDIEVYNDLRELPMFRPEDLEKTIPGSVKKLKEKILGSDAVLISTPEYTHNIPAVLKNALEWMTASGEFCGKRMLVITFTPKEPRGKYAMESLLFSLKTLDARIVGTLAIYKTDSVIEEGKIQLSKEILTILKEAMSRLE